jgi:hypothetical protein
MVRGEVLLLLHTFSTAGFWSDINDDIVAGEEIHEIMWIKSPHK